MRTSLKLVGALAAAGLVAAAGSAVTATGVDTTGNAAAPQFVGGTITQAVTGATLTNIAYTFADATNEGITAITLTFADANANGRAVTVALTGTDPVPGTFTCTNVSGTGSTCSINPVSDPGGNGYIGLNSLAVTVASSQ